jgi:hypothetical protein
VERIRYKVSCRNRCVHRGSDRECFVYERRSLCTIRVLLATYSIPLIPRTRVGTVDLSIKAMHARNGWERKADAEVRVSR